MEDLENHQATQVPESSFWPVLLAFGLLLIAVGIIFTLIISVIGIVILLGSIVGWTLENRRAGPVEEVEHGE